MIKIQIQCDDFSMKEFFKERDKLVTQLAEVTVDCGLKNERIQALKHELANAHSNCNESHGHYAPSAVTMIQLSDLMGLVANRDKIPAIKLIREITGCGLKEGKDLIEGNVTMILDKPNVGQNNYHLRNYWATKK